MRTSPAQLRVALLLGMAATLATLALLPYLLALQPHALDELALPAPILIAAQTLQNGVICFVLAWAGLKLGASLDLGAPWLASRLYPGRPPLPFGQGWASAGLGAGAALLLLAVMAVFGPALAGAHPAAESPSPWQGALATFYGGIVEETELRLFLLTLIAWLLAKVGVRRPRSLLIAIVAAALLFGVGHLPMAAKLAPLDIVTVTRVIGYNALLGLVFGWLYCRRGLEHAMLGHFSADWVLHVLAPLAHWI